MKYQKYHKFSVNRTLYTENILRILNQVYTKNISFFVQRFRILSILQFSDTYLRPPCFSVIPKAPLTPSEFFSPPFQFWTKLLVHANQFIKRFNCFSRNFGTSPQFLLKFQKSHNQVDTRSPIAWDVFRP